MTCNMLFKYSGTITVALSRAILPTSLSFLPFYLPFLHTLIIPTMPPSRHQTSSNTSHKPPYTKERATGGMKGPSRQTSTGSTGATGTVAAAKASPDKMPTLVQEKGIGEASDAKMEKRRKKKAKRERESNMDVDITTNVKPEEKVVRARPLAPSNISQTSHNTNINKAQTHLTQPVSDAKASAIPNNASQLPKPESRSNKLEQKVEKQKMKLKEAEARAAADAERSRKDAERIKELENSVKELKSALEAKEEAAEGVQGVVDQQLEVSSLFVVMP